MEITGLRRWLSFLGILTVAISLTLTKAASGDGPVECNFTKDSSTKDNSTKDGEVGDIMKQFITFDCKSQNQSQNGLNESSVALYRLNSSDYAELVEYDQWYLTQWDNGVTFVCAESGIDGFNVLCEATPLEVPPNVTVKQSILQSDTTAIFVCVAEGIPRIDKYKWYIDGEDIVKYNPVYSSIGEKLESRHKAGERGVVMYSDQNAMEVVGLSIKDRGMVVSCEVEIPSGLSARSDLAYLIEPETSTKEGMTSDKVFLFGLIVAGGVPIVFAIVAAACWVVRRGNETKPERKRSLTVEEEDLSPIAKSDSLPRSVASGVTSDMPPNAVLFRSHSIRSTKDKVGPMSQLVLPPIGTESNRTSQHIYDEAPHFATSELALSRGKHSATLPTKTYTSRSSLYRMSADYADVQLQTSSGNYENFRMQSTSTKNGNPNATLPAIRI